MKRLLALPFVLLVLVSSLHAAEWDAAKLAEAKPVLQAFVDQGELAGAVGVVGDSSGIKAIEAVGLRDLEAKAPMQKDSLFRIASMTKPITAIGIMILMDEGKISPDDPVEKYLPAFKGKRFGESDKPVLVRHLLTHTSGMPGGFPKALGNVYQTRGITLAEGVEVWAQEALVAEPGTKWTYNNPGIDTLGRLIELRSGKPYEEFLEDRVFNPLGMKDTCFYPSDTQIERAAATYGRPEGKLVASKLDIIGPAQGVKYPIPAGGLYSTGPDLAKLYQMMLNRGEACGKRIISEKSVRQMTTLQTGDIPTGFVNGMGFGFGWAVVRDPQGVTAMLSPGTFGHGGAFGTQGWIDPAKDMFVILLIQRTGLKNGDNSEMRKALQEVAAAARK